MGRQDLLVRLNEAIDRLSKDLPDEEIRHGWTEDGKAAMRKLLEQMRTDALQGKELKSVPHYVAAVRGLDHWGVTGGDLFIAVAAIGALAKTL